MRRCVSSGRLPATCTGNSLLGAFGQMVAQVLPSAAKEPAPGPEIAGVFEGAGNWRLDFIDGGVLVNCSFLAPDQHNYTFDFKNNRAAIVIDTTPKPLVLTLGADGKTMTGPGPVQIDGVIVSGYDSGLRDPVRKTHVGQCGHSQSGPVYDSIRATASLAPPMHPGMPRSRPEGHLPRAKPLLERRAEWACRRCRPTCSNPYSTTATKAPRPLPAFACTASSRPPPASASSSSPSPSSSAADPTPRAPILTPWSRTEPGRPSKLTRRTTRSPSRFGPNGSLDPGSGPYQVHGRIVVGQNDNGDFTFAPMEQTCNLAVLAPSKTIPSGGGTARIASAGNSGSRTANGGGSLSTPAAPLGNATLSIVSGFPAQAGAPNPLAGRPYVLLRDSYANALAKGGVSVPPGMSPYKYVGTACASRTPDCQKIQRRHQGQCRLSRPGRRQRQRNLSRRASGNLLPDDLRSLQQPGARLGSGRATQGRLKLADARSEQRNSDQLKKTKNALEPRRADRRQHLRYVRLEA